MFAECTPDLTRRRSIFLRKLHTRVSIRRQLSRAQQLDLDNQLYDLIAPLRALQPEELRHLRHLLNRGAAAHYAPIAGHDDLAEFVVDPFEDGVDHHEREYIMPLFALINELVASASTIWISHRHVWYDGPPMHDPLPTFLLQYSLTGKMFYYQWRDVSVRHKETLYTRHQCWCTFRRMVWAAEALYQRGERHEDGLLPGLEQYVPLPSGFLLGVYRGLTSSLYENVDHMRFRREMIEFFRPRLSRRRVTLIPEWRFDHYYVIYNVDSWFIAWELRAFHLFKQSVAVSLERGGYQYLLRLRGQIPKIWTELMLQREFRALLRTDRFIKHLCRSKNRKMFNHLVQVDEIWVRECGPKALEILESKEIRGKKERIIEVLYRAQARIAVKERGKSGRSTEK